MSSWKEIDPKDFKPVLTDGQGEVGNGRFQPVSADKLGPFRTPIESTIESTTESTIESGGKGRAEQEGDQPDRPTCYNKAIDLLSRRPHFSSELRTKLRKRSYDEVEIAATVERLAERKFLNDPETARFFVESRLRRGGVGRRKLLADLQKRGVDGDLAEEVLSPLGYEEELVTAREAARRFSQKAERATERAAQRRLAAGQTMSSTEVNARDEERAAKKARERALSRHLDRKGFSKRVILAILGEAP